MKVWKKYFVASVVAAGLVLGGTTPANASDEPDVRLVIQKADAWVDVDMQALEAAALDLQEPAPPVDNVVGPRLIDFNQWVGCFSLNRETDVFAYYWFPWNGRLNAVNLKCGNSSYGYKHIRENHEAQWQQVLDTARARGWQSAQYGVESWDDLMSGVTSGVVADPGAGLTKYDVSNKWCTKTTFGLWDTDQNAIVYDFGVETAWASDSDRLITSFPSSRKVC